MKIVLRDHRLSYVDIGTRRIHAKSAGGSPENPLVNISHYTLCGQDVSSGILTTTRVMNEENLCKICLKNLRRFPRGWIEEVET